MNEVESNEMSVYEVGYHVVPSVSETEVTGITESLKKAVVENKGSVLAEEAPKLIPLAYDIGKFNKAYFGWVKFEMEPGSLAGFDAFAKQQKQVLRFLIVKTSKENSIHYHKIAAAKREEGAPEEKLEGEEVKKNVVEEIDKSIEDLVIA